MVSMRYLRDISEMEVKAFLGTPANAYNASSSIHNQALSALLFLCNEVLEQELPWLNELSRPAPVQRTPTFSSHEESAALIDAACDPLMSLVIRLIYGAGLRSNDCLRMRVKDVGIDRRVLVVRQAKRNKVGG